MESSHFFKFGFTALVMIYISSMLCIEVHGADIPIPQKRPSVMMASPNFIERVTGKRHTESAEEKTDLQDSVSDLSVADILNVLEPVAGLVEPLKAIENAATPTPANFSLIPQHKPAYDREGDNTTLVSFTLQPTQKSLDDSLRTFLSEHAMSLLQETPTLLLDIQAYTRRRTDEDQSQSARIGLARSLDIRRFLVQKGVRPEKIKISPVHTEQNDVIEDRVDLVFRDMP